MSIININVRTMSLFEYEVILNNGEIYKINAISYDTNGNSVTFYLPIEIEEKLIESKNTHKIRGINTNSKKEILDENLKKEKRKIPFKTFTNLKEITLLNIINCEEYIEQIGTYHVPYKDKNEVKEIKNIENNFEESNINSAKESIKISSSLSEENINKEINLNNSENSDNFEDYLSENELGSDSFNLNNSDNDISDLDIMNILNETESNTTDSDNDILSLSDLDFNEDLNNLNISDLSNELSKDIQNDNLIQADILSKNDISKTQQDLINRIQQRKANNTSQENREDEENLYKIINQQIGAYLSKTNVPFNIKAFYEFLTERLGEVELNEDDIIVHICKMIKNNQIQYSKFIDRNKQDYLDSNRDIIKVYYNGDLNNIFKMLQDKGEQGKTLTMIDLIIWLKKNNLLSRNR